MKTLVISFLFIIKISFLSLAQTSLKVSDGVLKINESTSLKLSSDLIVENDAYVKNDGIVELKGHLRNNGHDNTVNYATVSTIGKFKFTGSSEQIVMGNSETIFEDIDILNTSADGIALSQSIKIKEGANFEDGVVHASSTNLVKFLTGASVVQVSDASFVEGPVSKTGNTDFTFPIGRNMFYRNATLSALSGIETYTAEYFDEKYTDVSVSGQDIDHINIDAEYWSINRLGSETATLRLSWDESALIETGRMMDVIVAHFDGADWISNGGNNHVGDETVGTVDSDNSLSSFGLFTLGLSPESNPLPVELIDFSAICADENGVNIQWSTATESNNDFFMIEKSKDAATWQNIAMIEGAGESNTLASYNYFDTKESEGATYYRLIQNDFNGEKEVFQTYVSACASSKSNLKIFPNPASSYLNISFESNDYDMEELQLKIYNAVGQIRHTEIINDVNSSFNKQISLPSDLKTGTYLVVINNKKENIYQAKLKIIK